MASVVGMPDTDPLDCVLKEECINKITEIFRRFGGLPVDTPTVEYLEGVETLYGEGFSKEVFSVIPRNICVDDESTKKEMIMRYDLTLPFARYAGSKGLSVFRRYQIGKVYRHDVPNITHGRFREFYQADFDIIGSDNDTLIQEGEILSLINMVLKSLLSEKFKIRVNDKELLFELLNYCKVPHEQMISVISSLDKLDKKNWDDVIYEMISDKKINNDVVNSIYELFSKLQKITTFNDIFLILKPLVSPLMFEKLIRLSSIIKDFELEDVVIFDACLARGLDYYTGLLYEAVIENKTLLKTTIASGGRYDRVIEKFSNKGQTNAIGVSFGLERIIYIKKLLKNIVPLPVSNVYVASVGNGMFMERQKLVNKLRSNNISAITSYSSNPKMRMQFDYVFDNNIPFMIIIGKNEIDKGVLMLKNISTKEQKELTFEQLLDEMTLYNN